jgi:anti-sigma-K factor RskA
MNIQHNDALRDRLSAAYVLGTLRGGARRRFDTLLKDSVIIQREVAEWQDRLHPLAEFSPAEAPPPRVWRKIATQTGLASLMQQSSREFWLGLRNDLAFWRGLGLVSTAVATILVAFLATKQPDAPVPVQSFVAMLTDDKAQPMVAISADPVRHQLTARLVAHQALAADKSLELWAIPKEGAPRPLGLLARDGSITLPLPVDATPQTVTLLAVSLEPLNGSPNPSGPTGPILFKGAWAQI